MPLRCIDPRVNNSLHAFDLSHSDWKDLEAENRRLRHLAMPCCQSALVLKTSRRGTQFFAHKSDGGGGCGDRGETEEHLRLKQLAVEVARAQGWDAKTEVAGATPLGDIWKADVLATNGSVRFAIEIQWSLQADEETLRRQARYKASGVRGLWLLRQSSFPTGPDLPAARVEGNGDAGFVAFVRTGGREQTVTVPEFLMAALSDRLRFGVTRGADAHVSLRTGEMSCWSCGADTPIVTGVDVSIGPHLWPFSVSDLDTQPGLFAEIQARFDDPSVHAIKHRFSRTQDRSYLSNGCIHCDALIGAFYEHEAWGERTLNAFNCVIDEQWLSALRNRPDFRPAWAVYEAAPRTEAATSSERQRV